MYEGLLIQFYNFGIFLFFFSNQMEAISPSIVDSGNLPIRNSDAEAEGFKHSVDEILQKVDKVNEILYNLIFSSLY